MYRTNLNPRDKSGALIGVAIVHALLFVMLLQLSGKVDFTDPQSITRVFDVTEVPTPPPEPPIVEQRAETQKPKETEGAASPKNIRSQATPVVAPRPEISLPVPVPVETSKTPNEGVQATQGASDVVGPGTGAGGTGTGSGSGGSGSGTGGGGGGVVQPPQLATPVLVGRDFPRDLVRQWPGRTTVFLVLRVDSRGFVSECKVDRGTGVGLIDSTICNVAHDRLRFRPARDRQGRPVAGFFGYAQRAPR